MDPDFTWNKGFAVSPSGSGTVPCAGQEPTLVIPAHLEKKTSNMFPGLPGQELPQEEKVKVSDIAGVQLMLCSHSFFPSVLIKTPHFPEAKLVKFTLESKCQQHQANYPLSGLLLCLAAFLPKKLSRLVKS